MECITDLKDYNEEVKSYTYLRDLDLCVERGPSTRRYRYRLFRPFIIKFGRTRMANVLIHNGMDLLSPKRDLRTATSIHVLHSLAKYLKVTLDVLGVVLETIPNNHGDLRHKFRLMDPSDELLLLAKNAGINHVVLECIRNTFMREMIRGLFSTTPMPFCVSEHSREECKCHQGHFIPYGGNDYPKQAVKKREE